MHMTIRPLLPTDIHACSEINRSLPDWFGIEEGLAEAEGYLRDHTGFVAESAGCIIGYLTYEALFPESAEISWMAIEKSHHRKGIGRALITHLEAGLRERDVEFLSVKTLAASHPSPEYATTRAFYESVGFHNLMVFPELWDPSNPCLLMVKTI